MSTPTMLVNLGPGGMPVARRQMIDDMATTDQQHHLPSPAFRGGPGGPGINQHQLEYPQSRSSMSSAGSLNRPSSRTSTSSGEANSRSSAMHSPSSKLSFFGGRKKKQQVMDEEYDDFDDDKQIYASQGDISVSMKDLSGLRDRDRYPTMGNDPSAGRTMSMISSFDTTPIIPMLGQAEYRKTMSSHRNQVLRSDYPPGPMMNAGLPNGFSPHTHHGSPPFAPHGRAMPSQEMARMRNMPNAAGPQTAYDYSHSKPVGPGALAAQGRSMSLGFTGGPSPKGMGPRQGNMYPQHHAPSDLLPAYGTPPLGPVDERRSNSSERTLNGARGISPSDQSYTSMANRPHPTTASLEPLQSHLEHPRSGSRSSSKTGSSYPADNSMSRPNSQSLTSSSSSTSSSPSLESGSTVSLKPTESHSTSAREPVVTKTIGVGTDHIETKDRATSPLPSRLEAHEANVLPNQEILDSIPTQTPPVGIMQDDQNIDLVERASSPISVSPQLSDSGHSLARSTPTSSSQRSPVLTQHMDDLKEQNLSLLNEVRLVTSELADSIRRELDIPESVDLEPYAGLTDVEDLSLNHLERAKMVIHFQAQLDLERRKRQFAEDKLRSSSEAHSSTNLEQLYGVVDLDHRLASVQNQLSRKEVENEEMRRELENMKEKFHELELETAGLKTGTIPELQSHVQDLELLTAAGNPIELLQNIEELKVENKKLTSIIEENSSRGPIAEKVKTIESQRDALRDALRSLRERKDHEIRQYAAKVRQLDSKLEKERLVNNQLQRKCVQGLLTTSALSSPAVDSFGTSDNFHLQLPSRSQVGSHSSPDLPLSKSDKRDSPARNLSPIIILPFNTPSPAPSPVIEIGKDPSWVGSSHREHLPDAKFSNLSAGDGESSPRSGVSLSLPNGRTEQLPLFLAGLS